MESVVIGVDLAAGNGVTAMAALKLAQRDAEGQATLSLLSLTYPLDDEAILAEVACHTPLVVGIDAPLSLPTPVASAVLGAAPSAGLSPYTRAAERDPIWARLGVRPFPVSFLGGLTFRAIPLAARLRARFGSTQVIEVFPTATLAALNLRPPATRTAPRLRKTEAPARRAIQHALAQLISGVAAPDDDTQPLDADSLDALAAALTAATHTLDSAQAIGDPDEGCIVLPTQDAQDRFVRVSPSIAPPDGHE